MRRATHVVGLADWTCDGGSFEVWIYRDIDLDAVIVLFQRFDERAEAEMGGSQVIVGSLRIKSL